MFDERKTIQTTWAPATVLPEDIALLHRIFPNTVTEIKSTRIDIVPSAPGDSSDAITVIAIAVIGRITTETDDLLELLRKAVDYRLISIETTGTVNNVQLYIPVEPWVNRDVAVIQRQTPSGGLAGAEGLRLVGWTSYEAQPQAWFIIARIEIEYRLEQRYYSAEYTRDKKKVSEGWAGYEWEESGVEETCNE